MLIVRNYRPDRSPIVTTPAPSRFRAGPADAIFLLDEGTIAGCDYPAPGIYLPRPQEDLEVSERMLLVQFRDAPPNDIFGFFTPSCANDTELDGRFHTSHKLLFANRHFRSRDEAVLERLPVRALSEHLKAELVELKRADSLVPLHCHGKALQGKAALKKFDSVFSAANSSGVDENHAHPQIIVVLGGTGRFYLDLEDFEVKTGDVLVYGPDVVHGSSAGPEGMSFIHLGWRTA